MNLVVQHFFTPAAPVFALWIGACLLVVLEFFPGLSARRLKLGLAIIASLASLSFSICLIRHGFSPELALGNAPAWLKEFAASYRLDLFSAGLYAGIALFTALSLLFIYQDFQDSDVFGEILVLVLFIASGMQLLVSADSLLMAFLGLELLSLPTYVLVGIRRKDKLGTEAALKYFLFGSFASALFVFGAALLYAQFGTMHLSHIVVKLSIASASATPSPPLLLAGLALVTVAAAFKVGIAPFHMWLPDVYQGAPSSVTGFMGSAIKLAGFGLVLRLMWGMFLPIASAWTGMLCVLSVITILVGNIAALVQDNLKRMFAYSSVSHAGYLLLGVAAVAKDGPNASALYYYLMVYGLMFLGLFAILSLVERATGSTDIFQLSGMGFTHPVLGACLALFTISGAGIPPTAGFLAKYFVFYDAVKAGFTPFVILGVLGSLIGAYYYLRVLVFLYMKDSKERVALPSYRYALVGIFLCAVSMVFFAFSPSSLGL